MIGNESARRHGMGGRLGREAERWAWNGRSGKGVANAGGGETFMVWVSEVVRSWGWGRLL